MIIDESEYMAHYGVLRRSGRYPWGSGVHPENQGKPYPWAHHPTQAARNRSFQDTVADLRRQGLTATQIARGFGMSTTDFHATNMIARNQLRAADQTFAQRLRDKGVSNVEIGRRMGHPESWVRAILAPGQKEKTDILTSTANMLKREVGEKKYVDVGEGVESFYKISKVRLNTAVSMLKEEGYKVHSLKIQTFDPEKPTRMKILTSPGTEWSEVQKNKDKIAQLNAVKPSTDDGGRTWSSGKIHPPISIDPSRVSVRYGPEGGSQADGVIYVRPGVEDVSLGQSLYAQVRVKVGDNHFLKGMAMYKDDLPHGADLVFNTSKTNSGNKFDAMKELTPNPDYPFGTVLRHQITAGTGDDEHPISVMNLVNEEGDWGKWRKSISAQVLSKQAPSLAKKQLDMTYDKAQKDFEEINALTNPTVKRKLMDSFAEATDRSAVDLKAAAINARQNPGWHAILPVESLKPGEVFAPNYPNGTTVALIRYPHAGTFEIPKLTVNNNHPESQKLLGGAKDAVGIHPDVAQRLSGADFDGDTVLVIPDNTGKIRDTPALDALKDFDPKTAYPKYDGMVSMDKERKPQEMGSISNLITDMTLKGADHEEIARAVKHSMVVIDAEKHELNYKQSAIDQGIRQLKAKYQGGPNAGADTLVSLAKSKTYVPARKPRPYPEGGPVDKTTGRKVFVPTGEKRTTPSGELVDRLTRSKKLAETDDAYTLVSKEAPIMERLYADHSNRLKDLANQARLNVIQTPRLKYSPSANRVHANEVRSLDSKLTLAIQNAPLERQAKLLAEATVKQKRQANPELDKDQIKKIKYQELETARARVGAKKPQIKITPEEWQAIQAGAISDSKLQRIIANADLDVLKSLATPRAKTKMIPTRTATARDLLDKGYTRSQIADRLGVSLTTLNRSLEEEA